MIATEFHPVPTWPLKCPSGMMSYYGLLIAITSEGSEWTLSCPLLTLTLSPISEVQQILTDIRSTIVCSLNNDKTGKELAMTCVVYSFVAENLAPFSTGERWWTHRFLSWPNPLKCPSGMIAVQLSFCAQKQAHTFISPRQHHWPRRKVNELAAISLASSPMMSE